MPRKRQYQWQAQESEQDDRRVSRSQRKRESTALQELGMELAKLPVKELEKLGLAPDLVAAYKELRQITSREARRRHVQYIGRLMREEDDIEKIQLAVALFKDGRLPSSTAID